MTSEPSHDSPARVVIIDDHAAFRQAARMLLDARGYDVVAEASCAAAALDAVERHSPDGALLDVQLGEDDGFAVCGSLTRSRPGLAVVLASADEPQDPERIARCGARGFVRKAHIARIDFGKFWSRGAASTEAARS